MIKPMQDVAKLLRKHEENILTYFDMPISNGIVKGLNNKAKVISHRAYRTLFSTCITAWAI